MLNDAIITLNRIALDMCDEMGLISDSTIFAKDMLKHQQSANYPDTAAITTTLKILTMSCYISGDFENAKMYELEFKSNERFIEPDETSLRSLLDFDRIRINLNPVWRKRLRNV